MILIDSIYIHSYGGLNILRAFVKGLSNSDIDKTKFHFLIDNRIYRENIEELKVYKTIRVKPSHFSRKKVYESIFKNYDKIICLSNIPPPIKIDREVYIYFHNLLLISSSLKLSSPFAFFLNFIKLQYIKSFNQKSYKWVTQTNYSKILLSNRLKIEEKLIKVLPFFDVSDISYSKRNFNSKTISYLCVSNNSKHKNIKKMINAFCKSNFDVNKQVELYITSKGKNKSMDNKRITYLGYVDRKTLIDKYSKSQYIVFPSLIESFGLPIVEGIASGANIISSDIESIKEIAKPSIKFNPKNESEIKIAFENSAKHIYNSNSKLTIKNEINNFIKLINNNV